MKIPSLLNEKRIKDFDFDSAIIASAIAAAESAEDYTPGEANKVVGDVQSSGARFIIPLLAPEGIESGDRRLISEEALNTRDLPLPLMWQIKTGDGHNDSVIVGRIDSIERVDGGIGNARGVFDVGPYGREAERMVRGGFLRGISADLDKFSATVEDDEDGEMADRNSIKNNKTVIKSARVMGATLVAKPSFQECFIKLEDDPSMDTEPTNIPDGEYEETPEDFEYAVSAIAASAAPVIPPREWFNNPNLTKPTPLTVTDEGRVFGHVAAWKTDHIGMAGKVKPPRSANNYAYFRTGELATDDGLVQVGQITLAGGHASMRANAQQAIKHYDDTASAMCDVTAGEDEFGIWVAGALRPDVTPTQVRAFRASAPSGDWRPIGNQLELVAVCAVNVPGFPIARTIIAGGQPQALVAAGAAYLAELKEHNQLAEMEARLKKLEAMSLAPELDAVNKRMAGLMSQRNAELSARRAEAINRMNDKKAREEAELSAKKAELIARFNA